MKNIERFALNSFTGSINMDLVTHIIDDSQGEGTHFDLLSVTRENVQMTQFYRQYVATLSRPK